MARPSKRWLRRADERILQVNKQVGAAVRLGGHLKTGHTWTPEKRPTQPSQDKSIYTAAEPVPANIFS